MDLNVKMTQDDYRLLNDAYYGEGGFSTGEYIEQFPRENEKKYKRRQKLAFFLNYIQPVIDSHVNAVFAREAERQYNKDPLFEAFINDCDANGNGLNRTMKSNALKAKLKGALLVVIDNFNRIPNEFGVLPEGQTLPDNLGSAIDNRILPYMFDVNPELIIAEDCEFDDRKNFTKIMYQEEDLIGPTGEKFKMKREWNTDSTILYQKIDEKWAVVENIVHGLGILPCFFQYGTENLDSTILPTSQFLNPAKVNKTIFNICSEIREIQRNQTFSILAIPGQPDENDSIGTENCLYFPAESGSAPLFIAPPDGPHAQLVAYVNTLIAEIYRMACVSYTQQYANTQQSGESKKWTFHITRQVLEDFAVNCEEAEKKISIIFGKWINKELDAVITYSRKYGADDIDQTIAQVTEVLNLDLGDIVKNEVRKKFIREYFADQPDEFIKNLEKALDEKMNQDMVNKENSEDEEEIDPITGLPVKKEPVE